MNIDAINLRIKKNKLPEYAGENYCDTQSARVQELQAKGNPAYLGIENKAGEYLIIGESSIFVRFAEKECEISFDKFTQAMKKFAMREGKKKNFDYVHIDGCGDVWVKDIFTMNALWNTVLLFSAVQQAGRAKI